MDYIRRRLSCSQERQSPNELFSTATSSETDATAAATGNRILKRSTSIADQLINVARDMMTAGSGGGGGASGAAAGPTPQQNQSKNRMSMARKARSVDPTSWKQQVHSGSEDRDTDVSDHLSSNQIVLIIDDSTTKWASKLSAITRNSGFTIRFLQVQFKDLFMVMNSPGDCFLSISAPRNVVVENVMSATTVKQFKPDLVLVMQNSAGSDGMDWMQLIVSMIYGGLKIINSLQVLATFRDRCLVHARLLEHIRLQQSVKQRQFNLVRQLHAFSHRNLVATKFPAVIKVDGKGNTPQKVLVQSNTDFQLSVETLASTGKHFTVEPLVNAQRQIFVVKIGRDTHAYIKRCMRAQWKCSTVSGVIEKVPVTSLYKQWISTVEETFGKMDMMVISALKPADGIEVVMKVEDCTSSFLNEGHDDIMTSVASLIFHRLNTELAPNQKEPTVIGNNFSGNPNQLQSKSADYCRSDFCSSMTTPSIDPDNKTQDHEARKTKRQASVPKHGPDKLCAEKADSLHTEYGSLQHPTLLVETEEPDDTMHQLKKSFASIFGYDPVT